MQMDDEEDHPTPRCFMNLYQWIEEELGVLIGPSFSRGPRAPEPPPPTFDDIAMSTVEGEGHDWIGSDWLSPQADISPQEHFVTATPTEFGDDDFCRFGDDD
jgi:hypothetical protein